MPTSATDPILGTRTIDFVYRPADIQPAKSVSRCLAMARSSPPSPSSRRGRLTSTPRSPSQGAEFETRDVLLVNTRGTGADAVDCPMLQNTATRARGRSRVCEILDQGIDFLTTGDAPTTSTQSARMSRTSAKVDLVTMGHATALGQAYLARYSKRVHTAILDEAVNINAWGDVEIKDTTAIAGLVCQRSARCSAQIDDPISELAWLAAKVRKSPVTGMTTLADGTPQRIVLGERELAWGLVQPEPAAYASGPACRRHPGLPPR